MAHPYMISKYLSHPFETISFYLAETMIRRAASYSAQLLPQEKIMRRSRTVMMGSLQA